MARGSFLGGDEGLEEECRRWCMFGDFRRFVLLIKLGVEALAEHDTQVQAFRRATSFENDESMFASRGMR